MKKVRGEVNPADLFTKHLPSREKVHQLLGLFGCEYRAGRAESAPLLRPHGNDSCKDDHMTDVDPLPTFSINTEGEIHDESRLPHMHTPAEIEKYFPTITAAPLLQNTEDWIPGNDEERDGAIPGGARGGSEQARQGRTRQQGEQAGPRTRRHECA